MAKNNLIGGSLWEQYSHKVSERMNNPQYRGEITPEEAQALGAKLIVADWGAESCGDAVRLYWAVDPVSNVILQARFKSFGCGTAIASSDMMAELCIGKTVDEAVKVNNLEVERALRDSDDMPAIPPQKMHCSVMAYDVIKKATALYKGVDQTTLEQEELVCECARVSLQTVREVIRLNDLTTVEQITQYTKAGAFCKSCIRPGGHEERKYYLVDILRDVRAEMTKEKMREQADIGDFKSMTLIQKHKAIEKCLDNHVRALMAADGGSVEVMDIKEENGQIDVYIRFLGACRGCKSSSHGTLAGIEYALKSKLADSIRVISV